MARLTPVNYNMQVLNPLQTAMAGYQAGFGQFQQLEDVRRQREADRMAAELHDAKMAEYERATAAAQAAQLEQAAFYEGFADGTHTPESLRRFRMSQNEVIREIAGEQLASLTEDGRRSQFDRRAGLVLAMGRNPEAALAMLEEERDAFANSGNDDAVRIIDGLLPIVRDDPAAGQAIAYQLAAQFGTDDEMDRLDKALAFGEPEEYQSAMDALGVRRYTEGPNVGEIVPGFEAERPREEDPGLQLNFDESGQLRGVSFGTGETPFDPTPEQTRGEQPTPVIMPGTGKIVISPSRQQSTATKEFSTLAAFKAKNEIVRDEVAISLELIEFGAGGVKSSMLREIFPNLTAGTATAALQSRIRTIRSNIGFNELSDMRQNSPTGGAVGNLSENEFNNLASLLGELDPARPEELAGKLNRLVDYIGGMEQRAESALMANYADIITLETRQREVERQTTAARRLRYDDTTERIEVIE